MDARLREQTAFRDSAGVYDGEDARGTIAPLPPVLTHGLGAVATFGFLSFFTSLSLFVYLTYKLVSWQLNPPKEDKRATSPEPESPTISDINGFLVPDSHLCPQKDTTWDGPTREGVWQRLRKEPPNQFLVLIYNLLFADIQQAIAFLLNVTWLGKNAVAVYSPVCWAQGWFVSVGDLASSVFITAIALHTYLGVIQGYRLPTWAFYGALAAMWGFVYGMALLGVIITNNGAADGGLYVRAGAWCWVNSAYQDLRLYLHYLWIFLSLALTTLIYLVIFFHLHIQGKNAERAQAQRDAEGKMGSSMSSPRGSIMSDMTLKNLPAVPNSARHPTFLLYPLIYVLCTAPLAAGRIASMAGNDVSLGYFCFAGAMIASAGWLDVALYSTTRRSIVFSGEAPPSQETGIETFAFMRTPSNRRFGNVVFVSGGDGHTRGVHDGKKWKKWNEKVVTGARMRNLKNESHQSQGSLKGFGSGQGEIMGMAIQCDTVTSVTVEVEDKLDDMSITSSNMGSRAGSRMANSRAGSRAGSSAGSHSVSRKGSVASMGSRSLTGGRPN